MLVRRNIDIHYTRGWVVTELKSGDGASMVLVTHSRMHAVLLLEVHKPGSDIPSLITQKSMHKEDAELVLLGIRRGDVGVCYRSTAVV